PHCLWPATATSLPRPSRQPRLFSLGAPAPTVTYTLSLHDALPIWRLRYAIDYRRTVMGEDFSNCRLIFGEADQFPGLTVDRFGEDRKSTRLNSSHVSTSYAVFCLKKQRDAPGGVRTREVGTNARAR